MTVPPGGRPSEVQDRCALSRRKQGSTELLSDGRGWNVPIGGHQVVIFPRCPATTSAKSRVGNLGGTPRSSRIETLVRRHHPAPSIDVRAANDCSGLLATAFQFIPNS